MHTELPAEIRKTAEHLRQQADRLDTIANQDPTPHADLWWEASRLHRICLRADAVVALTRPSTAEAERDGFMRLLNQD